MHILLNYDKSILSINENLIKNLIKYLLIDLKFEISKNQIIEINILNNSIIREISKKFLQKDHITDVITFDYRPCNFDNEIISELFISYEIAYIESINNNTNLSNEIILYILHGILHMSRFDDDNKINKSKMKREERSIMNKLYNRFDIDNIIFQIENKDDINR